MTNFKSLIIPSLFLAVISHLTNTVQGGCCKTDLNYCGRSFPSSWSCDTEFLSPHTLYSCQVGQDPVEIRECLLGCTVKPTDMNDVCSNSPPTTPIPTSTSTTPDSRILVLGSGERLRIGENIWATNSKARLEMQQDGNLVIYQVQDKKVLWATHRIIPRNFTREEKPHSMMVTMDGNIVMLNVERDVVNTVFKKPSFAGERYNGVKLRLDDDGSMCLFKKFDCLWKSPLWIPLDIAS